MCLLKMSIAMAVAFGCSELLAQRVGIGGGGGVGANVDGAGAGANVRGGAGVGVAGPRGGSVQVQPGGPVGGANVNVQGPRGGTVNVQPGVRTNIDGRVNAGARADFDRRDRGFADRDGDRWRFRWDGGRWWYWLPGNRWTYYDNGNWVDYANDYGGADSNYRWYNGYWWYWTGNGWMMYQNGQWVLPSAGYSYSDYDNTNYYYGGYNYGYPYGYYGYYGGYPYRFWGGGFRDFDRDRFDRFIALLCSRWRLQSRIHRPHRRGSGSWS